MLFSVMCVRFRCAQILQRVDYPLGDVGVALDRYLPERNAMLVNEIYVFLLRTAFAMIAATTPEAMMTTRSTGASTIPGIPAKKTPSPKR